MRVVGDLFFGSFIVQILTQITSFVNQTWKKPSIS